MQVEKSGVPSSGGTGCPAVLQVNRSGAGDRKARHDFGVGVPGVGVRVVDYDQIVRESSLRCDGRKALSTRSPGLLWVATTAAIDGTINVRDFRVVDLKDDLPRWDGFRITARRRTANRQRNCTLAGCSLQNLPFYRGNSWVHLARHQRNRIPLPSWPLGPGSSCRRR